MSRSLQRIGLSPDWQEALSIVIPAYNEEGGIGPTLKALREALPRSEIIVVDDGSRDATLERALAVPGVRVLAHAYNRGYGAALKTGMRCAERRHVAWFDADNEHRVEDLETMARRIADSDLSAVIGRRYNPRVTMRSVGKWVIRMLARSLGVDLGTDLNCGLRVFRRGVIRRYIGILPDAFSASMTSTLILIEQGHKIGFHDIEINPRIGESKVTIRDGFSTMALVMRFALLFAPLRIFFVPGLFLFSAGIVYGAVRAIRDGAGVPVAGMLVALAGLMGAMLGLIADQISQLRLAQLAEPEVRAGGQKGEPDVIELTQTAALPGDATPQKQLDAGAPVEVELEAKEL